MPHDSVKSSCSETWVEDNIIIQSINPGIKTIDIKIAKQLVKDRKNLLVDNQRFPVLVIPHDTVYIDKESRNYYKTDEPYEGILAIAIIIHNRVASLVGTIAFSFIKNKVPVKLFYHHQNNAVEWLKQFRNE